MSIKTRFLFSYIAVILVSITLILIAGFLIVFSITGDLEAVKISIKAPIFKSRLRQKKRMCILS